MQVYECKQKGRTAIKKMHTTVSEQSRKPIWLGKVFPRVGHEVPEGERGVALLFL
jgi:hypothetical protein